MKAGFSKVKINPPPGTFMSGWGSRDRAGGCAGIHDDIFVRTLWLSHSGKDILIMSFDLLFFTRGESDRLKGAIGRVTDLAPRQMLINASHTHNGPKIGPFLYDIPMDEMWFNFLEGQVMLSVKQAMERAEDATIWAGATKSALPLNRRLPSPEGKILFAPNPQGEICAELPVCALRSASGGFICVIFSVSCHPSTHSSFEISADYPGVAADMINAFTGSDSAMFLQGCGGDAKANIKGETPFKYQSWDCVEKAGRQVASEVTDLLRSGRMTRVEPDIECAITEMLWPLRPHTSRGEFENERETAASKDRRDWAGHMLAMMDKGFNLPSFIPVSAHGVKLGGGLRFIGLEGEPVARLGNMILDFYGGPVTFPLGYTNGAQLYLVTSEMLMEGGYEAESYYEYKWPSPPGTGIEKLLPGGLEILKEKGVL
jgi:hypothetical protein